ncbi:hypothetical protein HPB49_023207 [Dermacentor silvarum]|uniref:Uncharacterized protein n=1 Tax=Dermacentor silvarum TaxID=543639 RepID=A0ACB8DL98_DERSI|nr:hypothetical protein HPB49_023207 [Dermacentor silvarum]
MSSSSFQAVTTTFRKAFDVKLKDIAKWFPTHMYTGMKDMQRKLKSVDCVLELHDARVPLTGRNPNFLSMLAAIKPHVLLLNKADLADPACKATAVQQLHDQGTQNVLHIRSTEPYRNVDKIVPLVADLIQQSERYNRQEAYDYNIMVIGIPNVGKSVSHQCPPENAPGQGCYVDYLGLDGPSDDIRLVLFKTAVNMHAVNKAGACVPTWRQQAVNFIQGFRRGFLGKITFLPDLGNSNPHAAKQPNAV